MEPHVINPTADCYLAQVVGDPHESSLPKVGMGETARRLKRVTALVAATIVAL